MSPELLVPPVASPNGRFNVSEFDTYVMGTYSRFPLAIARGEGCRLWDTDGREYLDFVAGIATCTLGHAHPVLVEAVSSQIQKLHHVSNLYYIPEQGELARVLAERSAGDRAFFCNSGAEANEAAIKLARKYAQNRGASNPLIISAKDSFHGRTLATITATGQPKYQQGFAPLVPGFEYVPYNDIAAVEAKIDRFGSRIAAVMIEAIQGEGGVRPGELEYFLRLRKLCSDRDILLILDEVQAGVGRTGKYWGYENLGIEPDIFTAAKGLAGGVPIGAMICKESCNAFEPGNHASTFGGNPLVCAAGLAVFDVLERENLLANVQARGEQLRMRLRSIAQARPELFGEVRGWGLMNGLVLQPGAPVTSVDLVKAAIAEGLLLVPAGPQVLRFVPPLIVSAADIDRAAELLERAIASVA